MNKELREAVARAQYAIAKARFAQDPATISCGDDFADMVFPPWDEVDDKSAHFEDADAAISIIRPAVLEEAAKVASRMYRKGQIGSDIAAALRALAKEGE